MQFPSLTQTALRRLIGILAASTSIVGCAAAGLDFDVPFYVASSGTVTNRSFNTTNGPADGQRLLTGVRLVPSGADGVYIGIDRSTVWRVSANGDAVVESEAHPELADWAMGVTYDSQQQRVVLVTLGGEGFLYQRDSISGAWSEIASMQNTDLESLVYLPEDNSFYGIGVYNGAPTVPATLFRYSPQGEKIGEIQLPAFPVNLSPGFSTAKLVAVGGKIVALVESDPQMALQPGDHSRIYVIDPATGAMDLTFDHLAVPPQINLVIDSPKFSTQVKQGIPIHIAAYVESGGASSVSFYDGDNKIGDGVPTTNNPPYFGFVWTNAPVGPRALKAVGSVQSGDTFSSRTIAFTVVAATNPPAIRFVSPATNAMIFVGQHVKATVEVSDADNNLRSVEFSARGTNESLVFDPPPVGTNRYTFDWIADQAGFASLTGTARDGAGLKSSAFLQFTVLDVKQFVRRYLPTTYVAGVPFTVRLTAMPGTNIHAWAVEEHPPQGWVIQPETFDGVYDPANNVIKWGPFTDTAVRDLMYRVIPPTNSNGFKEFSGIVSANGTSTPIVGDLRITNLLPFHPADRSPQDHRITIDELTAYAAAWKTASSWPDGPVPIPVDFVTRAGQIWRIKEVYIFNPALPAPNCWSPPQQAQLAAALPIASEGTRVFASSPGGTTVAINVRPSADVQSYAIEERPPQGWTIIDPGEGSAVEGVVRFGPFFDAQPRSVTYQIVPSGAATLGDFDGVVSFDGASQAIDGAEAVTLPTSVVENRGGHVYLHLHGAAGQQYILESANALAGADWKIEMTITAADSAIDLPAIDPSETQKFYRLRPVTP